MIDKLSRRQFLRYSLGGVLGLGLPAIGGAVYATRIEPYYLDITRITLPLPRLAPVFDGYTIAQISDWHIGGWMMPARMLDIAAVVSDLNVDLIVVTGDFVNGLWPSAVDDIAAILDGLQAADGVYAILGNHDHWTDAPTIRRAIRASRAHLLGNESTAIRRGAARLYLAGVDDIWERQHDLDAALADVPPGAATILLAHEPDFADEAAATGRIDLQLSGHSHGGQVRLPIKGALILPYLGKKYDQGLYDVNGMTLYVNRGLGMTAPFVRFGCPPEITHITLAQPAD